MTLFYFQYFRNGAGWISGTSPAAGEDCHPALPWQASGSQMAVAVLGGQRHGIGTRRWSLSNQLLGEGGWS